MTLGNGKETDMKMTKQFYNESCRGGTGGQCPTCTTTHELGQPHKVGGHLLLEGGRCKEQGRKNLAPLGKDREFEVADVGFIKGGAGERGPTCTLKDLPPPGLRLHLVTHSRVCTALSQ